MKAKDESAGAVGPDLLAAYVHGEVTRSEAMAVQHELARSPEARRRVQAMRDVGAALARPIPELESLDMVARVRQAIAGEPDPRRAEDRLSRRLAGGGARV